MIAKWIRAGVIAAAGVAIGAAFAEPPSLASSTSVDGGPAHETGAKEEQGAPIRSASPAAPASPIAGAAASSPAVDSPPATPNTTAAVLSPRAHVTITRDLAYGPDPVLQSLDVYRPEAAAPLPVMVFIHGGGWSEGDKGTHPRKGTFFARQGFVYVTLNYRLSPAVTHPAHAEDVGLALGWIHAHIASYGGDPSRVFLVGHSAGAHLAALVATDPRYLAAAGMTSGELRGVALLDGSGYDLVTRMPTARGWSRAMFLQAFGTDPAVWKDASPVRHIEKGRAYPAFLLFHLASRKASTAQAALLAGALHGAGGEAITVPVTDRNHVSIARRLGLDGDVVAQRLLEFAHSHTR